MRAHTPGSTAAPICGCCSTAAPLPPKAPVIRTPNMPKPTPKAPRQISPLRYGQEARATGSTATDSQTSRPMAATTRYNLNRDLETVDFQSGLDLGKRGLLSDNDILVFGALGGFVHADLDYDAINRAFDFEGGQVGGYATYLRGGLFVDTLVNVHLMEIDTKTLGFPNSLNATTVGLRTDSGYRFGSFRGGAFIEPLATISVDWADIDGFSLGGNKVSFDDDPNVRGRLGLRVGTSTQVWTGITMEPFVIGSLWGNLSDDNQATLVSTGTTFHPRGQSRRRVGRGLGRRELLQPIGQHLRLRQARRHLRRQYRRRRRQSRHARQLVGSHASRRHLRWLLGMGNPHPEKALALSRRTRPSGSFANHGAKAAFARPLPSPAIQLDFGQLRDHSPATCDAEGALWRKKRCSNSRGW